MYSPVPSEARVDYADYKIGFSIFDTNRPEAIWTNEKESDDELDRIHNEDMNKKYEIHLSDGTPFDVKFSDAMLQCLVSFKHYFGDDVIVLPAKTLNGSAIEIQAYKWYVQYLENRINNIKISWSRGEANSYEDNGDIIKETSDELWKETFKCFTLSSKIKIKLEALYEFWEQPKADIRVQWIIDLFAAEFETIRLSNKSDEEITTITQGMMKEKAGLLARSFKAKGITYNQEIGRLIFGILALVSFGYRKGFPLMDYTFNKETIGLIERDFMAATGKFIFWSLIDRNKNENLNEGNEPLELSAIDSLSGPHYTLDYNDIIQGILNNSSSETEFLECFSTFKYTDDKGNEQMNVYKKTTDSRESKESMKRAIAIGDYLGNLYAKGVDFGSYRINGKKFHPVTELGVKRTQAALAKKYPKLYPQVDDDGVLIGWNTYTEFHGMSLIQYIDYWSGKRYKAITKAIEIDGETQEVKVKKYSTPVLVSFHEKKVREVFWSVWQEQNPERKELVAPPV